MNEKLLSEKINKTVTRRLKLIKNLLNPTQYEQVFSQMSLIYLDGQSDGMETAKIIYSSK